MKMQQKTRKKTGTKKSKTTGKKELEPVVDVTHTK